MNINAGDAHSTFRVFGPTDFNLIKVAPSRVDEAARTLGWRHPFRFAASSCASPRVSTAIEQLARLSAEESDSFACDAACHDLALIMVAELGGAAEPSINRSALVRDHRMRRLRERLIESAAGRPTLDELGRDTGLGKSQLCSLFKNAYGISIAHFWSGCRLAKARSLLLNGLPASRVAADLGFTDEAHFSRAFRHWQGLPPMTWLSLYRRESPRRALHAAPVRMSTTAKRGP